MCSTTSSCCSVSYSGCDAGSTSADDSSVTCDCADGSGPMAAASVADAVKVTANTAATVLTIYHQLIILRSPHLLLLYHLLLLLTFVLHHTPFVSFLLHVDRNMYVFLHLFYPNLEARAVNDFSSGRKANPFYELSDYSHVMGKSVLGAVFSSGPSHGGGA